ncbi:MAG: cytochrome c biogenesis protein CcsA [Bacteroidales bacterium]|nr:cytochrome c biogenesis protein CcsA [Bacteroidales bacterium]
MIKSIYRFLTSMTMMGVYVVIFALSIAYATIIENDYGTEAAKGLVYEAMWFNIMLALAGLNLIGNVIQNKLYRPQKFTVFMFHLAFIFILLGAGITRFISFEGMIHIREGEKTNKYISLEPYINVKLTEAGKSSESKERVMFTIATHNSYSSTLKTESGNYKIKLEEYIPNAVQTVVEDISGGPVVTLAVSGKQGRKDILLQNKHMANIDDAVFTLNRTHENSIMNLHTTDSGLFLTSDRMIFTYRMADQKSDTIMSNVYVPFLPMQIYEIDAYKIVLKKFFPNASVKYGVSDSKDQVFADALVFSVQHNNEEKEIVVRGKKGIKMISEDLNIGNANLEIGYGALPMELPFKLELIDFELERYPGSNSPSSYASLVKVWDDGEPQDPYRIYMNHILDYKGYRFFQSSFDQDEHGTVLSINNDFWGTLVTYFGYFFMALGMVLSLFSRGSRFRNLVKRAGELSDSRLAGILLLIVLFSVSQVQSQDIPSTTMVPPVSHAEKFGEIWVQDIQGRTEPINTLANEVIRKISRKSSINGITAEQIFLGIISNPESWVSSKIIKVGHQEVRDLIGIEGKYASYVDLVNSESNSYILSEYVDKAYALAPGKRSKFDKDIMAVDERLNIFYMVATGEFLHIFPKSGDREQRWYNGMEDHVAMPHDDSLFVKNISSLYLGALRKGYSSGDFQQANDFLKAISNYQEKFGGDMIPAQISGKLEIWYNNSNIFNQISKVYGLFGFVLLILLFIHVLNNKFRFQLLRNFISGVLLLAFLAHMAGLALRWYLSGHAPWSNGYESMIYITWVTMLAGVIFYRKSPITLAVTSVIASLALMVAHLSWLDPEITNLVPVLKSYWLTIHVSVITSSYGFLALAMLLGLFNIFLLLFVNNNNASKLGNKIQELTYINEMTMTIGLYLLTIGTFLGGVWANESWGRYWGWDPKETWSLVTVLVYSFIVHMRMIPGLQGYLLFNAMSVFSYFSVIMTYFGVNYLLSGLHSYAKGDPAPIPSYFYYTFAVLLILSIFAGLKYKKYKHLMHP